MLQELPVRSCNTYCSTFAGMECKAAHADRHATCDLDKRYGEEGVLTCDHITKSRELLCSCGFKSDASGSQAKAAFNYLPEFIAPNTEFSCPAYEKAEAADGREYYLNERERRYETVVYQASVDDTSGEFSVKGLKVRRDVNDADIDTYNTGHVEVCNGTARRFTNEDFSEQVRTIQMQRLSIHLTSLPLYLFISTYTSLLNLVPIHSLIHTLTLNVESSSIPWTLIIPPER
jgi:hypothetical protein